MKKPYRLYNGDCFEILKDFPENTFDMIFADPPYMLSNRYHFAILASYSSVR